MKTLIKNSCTYIFSLEKANNNSYTLTIGEEIIVLIHFRGENIQSVQYEKTGVKISLKLLYQKNMICLLFCHISHKSILKYITTKIFINKITGTYVCLLRNYKEKVSIKILTCK